MRIRKKNIAWLSVLAAMIGVVLLAPGVSSNLLVLLVGVFLVSLVASVVEIRTPADGWRPARAASPLTRMRMSAEAREASDRVRRRLGTHHVSDLVLLDIGLISSQTNSEGMVMRKSRSISADEDGVRPFISLYVPPNEADRNALIRFEILDQQGQIRYVHEMKTFLRDGEMNLLADHYLPLFENLALATRASGDWDLRVSIDSILSGMLSFTVIPSLRQRDEEISRRASADRLSDSAPVEHGQLSIEDLLRGQHQER